MTEQVLTIAVGRAMHVSVEVEEARLEEMCGWVRRWLTGG
jgi:hypothetical protein